MHSIRFYSPSLLEAYQCYCPIWPISFNLAVVKRRNSLEVPVELIDFDESLEYRAYFNVLQTVVPKFRGIARVTWQPEQPLEGNEYLTLLENPITRLFDCSQGEHSHTRFSDLSSTFEEFGELPRFTRAFLFQCPVDTNGRLLSLE